MYPWAKQWLQTPEVERGQNGFSLEPWKKPGPAGTPSSCFWLWQDKGLLSESPGLWKFVKTATEKNTINLEDKGMSFQCTLGSGALAVYGAELMVCHCLYFPYGMIYFYLNPNWSFVEILLLYMRYDFDCLERYRDETYIQGHFCHLNYWTFSIPHAFIQPWCCCPSNNMGANW